MSWIMLLTTRALGNGKPVTLLDLGVITPTNCKGSSITDYSGAWQGKRVTLLDLGVITPINVKGPLLLTTRVLDKGNL